MNQSYIQYITGFCLELNARINICVEYRDNKKQILSIVSKTDIYSDDLCFYLNAGHVRCDVRGNLFTPELTNKIVNSMVPETKASSILYE